MGRRVATSLGFTFVDTDEEIEKSARKSIPDIFEESGEDRFRELETEALRSCADQTAQVISTGGGIILREENREILKEAGYVIWLRASPEVILDRVSRSNDRPLLETDDPGETIRNLLDDRYPLYEESADLPITTDDLTLEETIYGVTESARVVMGVV